MPKRLKLNETTTEPLYKYRGVVPYKYLSKDEKPQWIAQYKVNKKGVYLGIFDDAKEAAKAYDLAIYFDPNVKIKKYNNIPTAEETTPEKKSEFEEKVTRAKKVNLRNIHGNTQMVEPKATTAPFETTIQDIRHNIDFDEFIRTCFDHDTARTFDEINATRNSSEELASIVSVRSFDDISAFGHNSSELLEDLGLNEIEHLFDDHIFDKPSSASLSTIQAPSSSASNVLEATVFDLPWFVQATQELITSEQLKENAEKTDFIFTCDAFTGKVNSYLRTDNDGAYRFTELMPIDPANSSTEEQIKTSTVLNNILAFGNDWAERHGDSNFVIEITTKNHPKVTSYEDFIQSNSARRPSGFIKPRF
jgi:hypothetical protein